MIGILQRYLARTIIAATLVSGAVIVAVSFVMTLLGEFKSLGHGDYGFTSAVFYSLLRLPNEIYQFSPLLMLLGSILGLSLLSSHRELGVMQASGFSTRKIMFSVFAAALLMIFFIFVTGELVGPVLSHRAGIHKENLENAGQAVVTSSGVWLHVNDNFVHIEHVVGKHMWEGVTRYQFDQEHRLQEATFAKTMTYEHNQWVMHDAVKTVFLTDRTMSRAYPELGWDLPFNTKILGAGSEEPDEMTLGGLVKYSHYLEKNGLRSSQYRYEFWERLFTPLASLAMIFIAIPFVLGAFRQLAMGLRLMAGVIAGFTFFILNAFLGQLCIVYQIPPPFAAFFPVALFGLLAFFMTRHHLAT